MNPRTSLKVIILIFTSTTDQWLIESDWNGASRWLAWRVSGTRSPSMMTSSNKSIFRVISPWGENPLVTGGFPSQRPVTRSFDIFFGVRLKKPWGKQWKRHVAHCDVAVIIKTYLHEGWHEWPEWARDREKPISVPPENPHSLTIIVASFILSAPTYCFIRKMDAILKWLCFSFARWMIYFVLTAEILLFFVELT